MGNVVADASLEDLGSHPTARTPVEPKRSRIMVKFMLLLSACVFAFAIGEIVVRIVRPGFLGYQLPQVLHRTSDLGYEMIPDQDGYSFASPVSVNSMGLRGSEIALEKSDSVKRIVVLGDSITYGVGVPDDIAYPQMLENWLNDESAGRNWEVINAGVQGYATHQEFDWFRRDGLKLNADIVVLGFFSNDIQARPKASAEVDFGTERAKKFSFLREKLPLVYLALKNSALIELAKQAYDAKAEPFRMESLNGTPAPDEIEGWKTVEAELLSFLEMAEDRGFAPLVVAIPQRIEVVQDFPNSVLPGRLMEVCSRLGLPAIDLLPEFKKTLASGEDPYLAWDYHLNEVGHRIVADAIRGAVK